MQPTSTPVKTALRGSILVFCLGFLVSGLFLQGCPSETVNTCTQDTECPSGQLCKQSRCEAISPNCSSDKDCPTGKVCVQQACKEEQTSCQNNSECKQTEVCLEGKCQPQICTDDRNCPSGKRCQGGSCVDAESISDGTVSEPPPSDGGNETTPETTITEGNPETPSETTPDQTSVCIPNRNGILERNELTFRIGAAIVYTAAGTENSPVEVDLKGTTDANGVTTWDFSKKFSDDTREVDEVLPYKGQWFEGDIKDPIPEYTAILTRNYPLIGVVLAAYRATPDALQMLGWYSQEKDRAKVKYNQPVEILQFPMKVGDTWLSKPTASGSFPQNFTLYSASEDYEFTVDAKGKAKLPAGTFDVLRLRMKFSQTQTLPAFASISRISYIFLAECYGIVARVDSKLYESDELFTKASRLKRLSD
ncbi:MAG: hypothetical protein H6727_17875 [Myxococcales bacterium]|nr:hypothetical protein [Myxococcales bacterium]